MVMPVWIVTGLVSAGSGNAGWRTGTMMSISFAPGVTLACWMAARSVQMPLSGVRGGEMSQRGSVKSPSGRSSRELTGYVTARALGEMAMPAQTASMASLRTENDKTGNERSDMRHLVLVEV